MKKTKIFISIVIAILLIANCTIALATTINPNDYKPTITSEDIPKTTISMANKIVTTITIIGTIIFMIVVLVLGFKYIVGSLEERAEYKKTMLPILVGAIMIFGASWIVKIIYKMVIFVGR